MKYLSINRQCRLNMSQFSKKNNIKIQHNKKIIGPYFNNPRCFMEFKSINNNPQCFMEFKS